MGADRTDVTMCLNLRRPSDCIRPYNRSRIRWKFCMMDRSGRLSSYYEDVPYKKQGWMKARVGRRHNFDECNHGFHVFTERRAIRPYLTSPIPGGQVVGIRVEVRGFLRSGRWMKTRCETWREMRILEVIKKKS